MHAKRSLSPAVAEAHSAFCSDETIYYFEDSIEDRASTFRAAFIPLPSDGVTHRSGSQASRQIQALPDFSDASHRVTAWRVRGAQKMISGVGLLDLGHDDDGEKWAGTKLEKLLDRERIEGAICVARWYGGVMLGPVRFTHIEDAAKGAIAVWRDQTEGVKRRKTEAEEAERAKARLVQTLKERDGSIAVLRKMLAQKTGVGDSAASAKQLPDYGKLPVETLRKLERARDSTIGTVLKKIEKAEGSAAITPRNTTQDKSDELQDNAGEDGPDDRIDLPRCTAVPQK